MMMTKAVWLVAAVIASGGMSVGVAAANSFVPGVEDLVDPLGRPSALAKEVIHSSSEFDRISGILVPKHGDLHGRITVLNGVADDLDTVVGHAGELSPLTQEANNGTKNVGGVSGPLPGLIGNITSRSGQAVSTVDGLHGSIGSVTTQLERIVGEEKSIYSDLEKLGPRARNISAKLSEIEEESSHLRNLAPVLRLLSGVTHP